LKMIASTLVLNELKHSQECSGVTLLCLCFQVGKSLANTRLSKSLHVDTFVDTVKSHAMLSMYLHW